MYSRHLLPLLRQALADSPVVLLNGARQAGKSTLAREARKARYLTMDDAATQAAAVSDPAGFIGSLEGPVILDEIQKAPTLLPAIKVSVDRDRAPGRFLLTGSADVLLLPKVSESLAGRMEILTLWPLSQGEIEGRKEGFVDALIGGKALPSPSGPPAGPLLDRILHGGYPEPLGRPGEERRTAWFRSYLTAILQRDVRDLANLEDLASMPRLLSLLAARAGGLLNVSEVSRGLGMPLSTLKRYLSLLEMSFLVQELPAWSGNLGKRLVRAPKLQICDSGLMAHLLGADAARVRENPTLMGPLLENFAGMELRKQASWSRTRPSLYHYRTHAGQEVDLVLETASGEMVGIEIKASGTLGAEDFRGLRSLQEAAGRRFRQGVVLYCGRESLPFGDRLRALPIQALWEG